MMTNSNDIDGNKQLFDAVTILTGEIYTPSSLLDSLETAYRTYAYNHIVLEDDSRAGKEEAANVLFALETLMDGLRGRYINPVG